MISSLTKRDHMGDLGKPGATLKSVLCWYRLDSTGLGVGSQEHGNEQVKNYCSKW